MPNTPPLINTDNLPCGVFHVSRNRQILYGNQYAANMLSNEPSQLIGRCIDELATAASRIIIDSYLYPLLLESRKAEELQINFRNPLGSPIAVVANISMGEDLSTQWTFMACENRDSLYEELLCTRDTLHQKTLELLTSNTRIQNEHDDLEVFCRSLSHDFTAPIQQIQQLVEFAMEDLQAKNLAVDDEVELLGRSIQCAGVLTVLIKGLVEYLSADARVELDEIVNLDTVVSSAIQLNEGDHALNITVGQMPTVIGNSAQLLIVFKNLIGNALKYTEGDVEVTISCTNCPSTGRTSIVVKDNGIGMPEKYLKRIFEPFSRLHGNSEYSGSGLGLSIVKKLLSNHNGMISVESTLGTGSSFSVDLPLHQPAPIPS